MLSARHMVAILLSLLLLPYRMAVSHCSEESERARKSPVMCVKVRVSWHVHSSVFASPPCPHPFQGKEWRSGLGQRAEDLAGSPRKQRGQPA